MKRRSGNLSFQLLCFVWFITLSTTLYAGLIAYDPFLNANVANAANDKLNGEYNAGSFFRDFTNGNNKDVAGGPIIGWSAANLWEGNSINTGTSAYIGPTDLSGLSYGSNQVIGGNVRARGISSSVSWARRTLDSYTGSNVYYMSGLVRGDNLSGNLNINSMMGFSQSIAGNAFDGTVFYGALFGFHGDGTQVDLVVRHRDETGAMVNSTLIAGVSDATTYFVVAKIEFDADGTKEKLTAWANPQSLTEAGESPVLTTYGHLLGSTTSMIRGGFYIENFDSNYQEYVQFDELKLGTQWSDAVTIPEPATISLFCLGIAGLLKKKNS